MVLSFNKMALQLTAHATQDWLHATAMTLLRSVNGHQTRQILICLIIMCGVPCWNLSQAGQVSHQQLRSFKQDWRWSGMIFPRNLWQGLSRTFVSDCKHAWIRLVDTWRFSVIDFMLMHTIRVFYAFAFVPVFLSVFFRKLHLICIRMTIFIDKFETLDDKNVVILCILWN